MDSLFSVLPIQTFMGQYLKMGQYMSFELKIQLLCLMCVKSC